MGAELYSVLSIPPNISATQLLARAYPHVVSLRSMLVAQTFVFFCSVMVVLLGLVRSYVSPSELQ
jgi:hypothetical protein